MTENPELDEFESGIRQLLRSRTLRPHSYGGEVRLRELTLDEVARLAADRKIGYYFLLAAAGLNRTSLKAALKAPRAMIVEQKLRRAFAIRERLPVRASFGEIAHNAIALRRGDLGRKTSGGIEALFRERLRAERIPLLMSPPIRRVTGVLVSRRKPDGVYPDPETNQSPGVYLEIKNVRRVSDDIQKRLYELAEASIEMKVLYGDIVLDGLRITDPASLDADDRHRREIRSRITASLPVVVGLFLCPKAEAERYRSGAEAFIDRVFFQEEIEAALRFLKASIRRVDEARRRPVPRRRVPKR